MKIRKLFAVFTSAVLLTSVVGCTKDQAAAVPEPAIPMKTVTQNSKDDYITFECLLPQNWIIFTNDNISVGGADNLNLERDFKTEEDMLSYSVTIKRYTAFSTANSSKSIIKELFNGNSKSFKDQINSFISSLNQDNSLNDETQDSLNSLGDYFDLMSASQTDNKPNSNNKQYISEFTQKCYQSKNGRIMEVRYNFKVKNKIYHAINCFLEDIPYVVYGGFDDTLSLSSGEIVLWVASSLKVTEHFSIKDGKIVKKG